MNDQPHDYYRRHLLLHEATHCYMQAMGGTTIDVPLWYLEGMAELFATHALDAAGRPTFRVLPEQPEEFVGFGRIEMIRQDIDQERPPDDGRALGAHLPPLPQAQSAYAWSWAICLLGDRNPHYHDRFQQLGPALSGRRIRRSPSRTFSSHCGPFRSGMDIADSRIRLWVRHRLRSAMTLIPASN